MEFHRDASARTGDWIHRRGSDFPRGAVLVPAGGFLGAGKLAVAAGCGKTSVEVTRLPRVGIVGTGDELVSPDVIPAPHQIRQSNAFALEALVAGARLGKTEVVHLPDSEAVMESSLRDLLSRVDVLVLSGGVSHGEKDMVPRVMERLGVRPVFHGVKQRPGRPFWFGAGTDGAPVFGFPGNPVSTLVGGRRYLVPALEKMLAVRPPPVPRLLPLAEDFRFAPPLTLFLPVQLKPGGDGSDVACPRPARNSGDYAGLVPTHGFLELPAERDHFRAGERFAYFPWEMSR